MIWWVCREATLGRTGVQLPGEVMSHSVGHLCKSIVLPLRTMFLPSASSFPQVTHLHYTFSQCNLCNSLFPACCSRLLFPDFPCITRSLFSLAIPYFLPAISCPRLAPLLAAVSCRLIRVHPCILPPASQMFSLENACVLAKIYVQPC
jgi:hypothetical protein